MGAVSTKVLSDLRNRRLQAFVIGLVLFLATAAATLALSVLVESQAPFDHAFAQANGAHLVVTYDGTLTATQLAATTHTAGVTDSAGPWALATVDLQTQPGVAGKGGPDSMLGQIAARPSPDTSVDRIAIVAGRWWERPGEIVVSLAFAQATGMSVGDTIGGVEATPTKNGFRLGSSPDSPPPAARLLTIVGVAGSISTPAVDGWLSPTDLAALTTGQIPPWQVLYRVTPSRTAADLAVTAGTITAGLPPSAVIGSQTYLAAQADVNRTAAIFIPILLAFALFALLAAGFIIANLVSGIVLGSYREIGVMKAIGYTPRQVALILVAGILCPVTVGSVAGIVLGTVGSQPLIAQTAHSFGLASAFSLSPVVVVGVLGAALSMATLAAIGPALRAGRLSAVAAITQGSTPSSHLGGGRVRRRALRLPLPTSLRLGLGSGLSDALRAAMTLGALVVGVAALVFALGLTGSLRLVAADLIRDQASPVRIDAEDPSVTPAQISATIASNPDTARFVAVGQEDVTVAQLGGPIPFVAYQGDSSWLGYALIGGRWFTGPGEAVAPTNLFTQTGLHVGDTLTVTFAGHPFSVKLVGEIFDQARENRDDLVLRGDWSDLAGVDPGLQASSWEVAPKPGTDLEAYRSTLQDATNQAVSVELVDNSATDTGFLLYEGVIAILGLILVVVSLAGVFNTVLLETRQRIRETAVLRAIGMTPRQVVLMVMASLVPVGLASGFIGVPLGIVFQHEVLTFMGQAADQTQVPASAFDVFPPLMLAALGLAGLAIGGLGAYLPAQRAARTRIAGILQAE